MKLFVHDAPSPIGTILLITDEAENLRALDFRDHEDRLQNLLRRQYGNRISVHRRSGRFATVDRLHAYFSGDVTALDAIPVRTGGTAFQREVRMALRQIPPGKTTSYGKLAEHLGRPKATRAVGLANGANPIAIVIPCHRVIGANGKLTGYGGGLKRKRWLLAHEAGHIPGQEFFELEPIRKAS